MRRKALATAALAGARSGESRRGRIQMRRSLAFIAIAASGLLLAAGCMGESNNTAGITEGSTTGKHEPVTLTLWTYWTGFEKKEFDKGIARFEAAYPWITVKHTGGVTEPQRVLAAITAGKPPDVWLYWDTTTVQPFCKRGALQDLNPYVERDNVNTSDYHPYWMQFFNVEGKLCAVPWLADSYGLYYNTALFQKAGVSEPPKNVSELFDDTKKLTEFNADGSIKVAGYVPLLYYNQYIEQLAAAYGADWFDDSGKSALATDPDWKTLFESQKEITDWYGYDKLQKFVAGFADESAASHAGQIGKVAMWEDGEWRVNYLQEQHPELQYATAPYPVSDDHPELYGSQLINTNPAVIPTGSEHPYEAWLLAHWLTTDTQSIVAMADELKNIPSWTPATESPDLKLPDDPHFKPFLDIYTNEHSATVPQAAIDSNANGLVSDLYSKYLAGKITDLDAAFANVASQINSQLAQGGG
jgi:multiple sugar transport system substrate-binding protein